MSQAADKVNVFRLADLTSKRMPQLAGGLGVGSVGYLGPDQDPDGFSPITPYVMVSKVVSQLNFLDQVDIAKLDVATLDRVALDIGRHVVAGKLFPGTALCTQDMPTCARNERISPIASLAETVTNIDLGVLRHQLTDALERIDRLDRLDRGFGS